METSPLDWFLYDNGPRHERANIHIILHIHMFFCRTCMLLNDS